MQSRWRRISATSVVLMIVSFHALAFAQSGPTQKYFMLPTQGVQDSVTTIVPQRIGELTREQVAKDARVDLLPPYDDLRRQLAGSTATIAQAEALYTSGIGLLTAGNDAEAADAFRRAIETMEQNLGDLGNFEVLVDATANLALANHNAGFDLDARKGIQAYAQLRPTATLDPDKFPKELIDLFAQEVAKIEKAGNGVLKITADKEGVVFIDGVEHGPTPVTVESVGFGHHYLVVRSGDTVYTEKIRVRGKKATQDFKATATSSTPQANAATSTFYADMLALIKSGTFTASSLGAYLSEFSNQTGAQHIGFVVMYKQGSRYVAVPFAFVAADNKLLQGSDIQFNIELSNLLVGVSALSDSLVTLALQAPEERVVTDVQLGAAVAVATTATPTTTTATATAAATATGSGTADPGVRATITPPEPTDKKSGNTWKYIGITAGAVVGAGLIATVVYLLVNSDGGNDGFVTEVQW